MTCDVTDLGHFLSGADVRFQVADDETDLTGRAASVIGASPELGGRITVQITDAENGTFTVHIEGTDPIRIGEYEFRVQMNGDGLDSIVYPYTITVC